MPTDEERREVAQRLRSVGLDDIQYSDAICEVMMCTGLTCIGDEDCHGSDERPECAVRVFARLADLIEPTPPHCIAEVKISGDELEGCVNRAITEYTGIDRGALLALADEIHGLVENQEIRFFHVVQVHESTLSTIERRIREACREVEG